MNIDIAFLPTETRKRDLSDTVCIILDIYRATSCIVTAFANGCQTISQWQEIKNFTALSRHRILPQH